MKLLALVAMFFAIDESWANLHLSPPDFETKYGRAIFLDFTRAEYSIQYDIYREETVVKSRIWFKADKTGHPIFDLVPDVSFADLDGQRVKVHQVDFPGSDSKLRILDQAVKPGEHVLTLTSAIDTNVIFDDRQLSVSSAFWIRDLKDRKFLEQYIPSNFEYDQYQMTFHVFFSGAQRNHEIFSNGEVSKTSSNSWTVVFPEYFTVSCPYFHVAPKGQMSRADFSYRSVNGRNIPITVYASTEAQVSEFKAEAKKVMEELEKDYGPWGHPSLLAYATPPGTGGMEHAGATATSISALDHEMLHSYFAKGVMPANGNSGWIDEAIASWRDKGYQRVPRPDFTGSNLGLQSVYKRNTDDRAYKLGNAFLSYIDYRLQNTGGLRAFLRGYFHAYNKTVITTEHFKNNLEFFSGLNLSRDFNTYIWGKNSKGVNHSLRENPYHPALTKQQLEDLL
ncbi:MAG TPA: hypothetical protein VNJ01_01960 [Bacteriovoracaceae bacterium]|nr:hypothetical protein [Bacteriovoracaceae bacterium]